MRFINVQRPFSITEPGGLANRIAHAVVVVEAGYLRQTQETLGAGQETRPVDLNLIQIQARIAVLIWIPAGQLNLEGHARTAFEDEDFGLLHSKVAGCRHGYQRKTQYTFVWNTIRIIVLRRPIKDVATVRDPIVVAVALALIR